MLTIFVHDLLTKSLNSIPKCHLLLENRDMPCLLNVFSHGTSQLKSIYSRGSTTQVNNGDGRNFFCIADSRRLESELKVHLCELWSFCLKCSDLGGYFWLRYLRIQIGPTKTAPSLISPIEMRVLWTEMIDIKNAVRFLDRDFVNKRGLDLSREAV